MTPNYFDQFMIPVFLGVPLALLAMALPLLLCPRPSQRWLAEPMINLQNWFIGQFVGQLLRPLNKPGHKWALLLSSLLLFILNLNLLGLLPYTFTPTTQLSLCMGLATPLWLATVVVGLKNHPTSAFAHLLPEGTPYLLIPMLVIIETISLFIRPLALGVRLTANLTAGHLLIQLIATGDDKLASMMPVMSILVSALLLAMTLLEMAVALIQAYVFVALLTLYLQENTTA
uniref:ATP synthase subunit a n=1 Tax=Cryptopsaras couesii TaxID=412659 RepID=A0A6B9IQ90_CRYCE|nr:ATP synthase F0 subunit 6 [Cryptopsaras couesii]QGZ08840.1 ATP synthase F0 subunit 6 [Cryptopsaras couesii]